ncbi:MAG TPA: nucleotidyltransferase domain-containing protein [Methylocystis sp.]|nr:nucleotidyltransferase domain-containing protein [Methylocystis sp.]
MNASAPPCMSSMATAWRGSCYSARARGDARTDSDYDIAVFLHGDMPDRIAERYRLADVSAAILEETGEFIHAMPYRADAYNERTPLMHEIRREGVDL